MDPSTLETLRSLLKRFPAMREIDANQIARSKCDCVSPDFHRTGDASCAVSRLLDALLAKAGARVHDLAHDLKMLKAEADGLVKAEDLNGDQPAAQCDDAIIVRAVTAIVRVADKAFQQGGGSSAHWVRDCFLPELNMDQLKIVVTGARCVHCNQAIRQDERGRWMDRETHTHCGFTKRAHEPLPPNVPTEAGAASLPATRPTPQEKP